MAAFKIGRTYRWAGLGSATNVRTFSVLRFDNSGLTPRVVIRANSTCDGKGQGQELDWNLECARNCVEIDGTEDDGLTLVVGDTPAPSNSKSPAHRRLKAQEFHVEHYKTCKSDFSYTQLDMQCTGDPRDILQCNSCGAVEEIDGGRGPKKLACPVAIASSLLGGPLACGSDCVVCNSKVKVFMADGGRGFAHTTPTGRLSSPQPEFQRLPNPKSPRKKFSSSPVVGFDFGAAELRGAIWFDEPVSVEALQTIDRAADKLLAEMPQLFGWPREYVVKSMADVKFSCPDDKGERLGWQKLADLGFGVSRETVPVRTSADFRREYQQTPLDSSRAKCEAQGCSWDGPVYAGVVYCSSCGMPHP